MPRKTSSRWPATEEFESAFLHQRVCRGAELCYPPLSTGLFSARPHGGTEGSNPSPSSEESRANLKTTSTFALRHSIAIRVPKKTPASMITDTGKVAGGKPATGRLCQAGLREKASVRHLARRLTGYRKESSTNSRDNVQGNSSPQRSERRGTERLDYRTSEGRVLATW